MRASIPIYSTNNLDFNPYSLAEIMSDSSNSKSNTDFRQLLPHLMAGASVALSLYTLYKQHSSSNINNNNNKSKAIVTRKGSQFLIPDSNANHAVLSRVMLPDDANPGGNVHGGTTLKMIGHAGWLAANRYLQTHSNSNTANANSNSDFTNVAVIVRMNGMQFKQPIFIGEVATVDACVTYTANHSCEVQVRKFWIFYFCFDFYLFYLFYLFL